MFNSDLLANRPSPAIVGRIFIAIDAPYGIFRDTGSVWDQITSSGSFSGSLATGQVAFGSATNTISGTNNLFYDNANGRLGIGTATPDFELVVTKPSSSSFKINTGATSVDVISTTALSPHFNTNFLFYYGNPGTAINKMTLFGATGNLVLQNGGTFSDLGQRIQVNGTSLITGASTFGGNMTLSLNQNARSKIEISNTTSGASSVAIFIARSSNGGVFEFSKNSATTTAYKILNPSDGNLYNFIGDIAILNDNTSGSIKMAAGGSSTAQMTLTAAGRLLIGTTDESTQRLQVNGDGLVGGSLAVKTTSHFSPSTFSVDINGGLLIKNTGTLAQITLINADPAGTGDFAFIQHLVGGTAGGSFASLQGYYGLSITGSTALRLNPAGGNVVINATSNSGEQLQLTGSIRVNGQLSGTAGGNSGQHLIINCDGTIYKIRLENN